MLCINNEGNFLAAKMLTREVIGAKNPGPIPAVVIPFTSVQQRGITIFAKISKPNIHQACAFGRLAGVAERSKAPDLSSGLNEFVGSNPIPCTNIH